MINWLRKELRNTYEGLAYTNGRFSSTKAFSSAAYAIALWVVIHQEIAGTLSVEMMLAVLATVAGHNILLRKWTQPPQEDRYPYHTPWGRPGRGRIDDLPSGSRKTPEDDE